MGRHLNKALAAGAAGVVALLLLATTAAAHTTGVSKSDPANGATVTNSPAQVTAQFTEELRTRQSVMQVFDAAGNQVSEGNGKVDLNDANHQTMIATLPNALPAGAYTVKWHVYLTDGDDSSGAFDFKVAAAAGDAAATAAPTAAPASTQAATALPSETPTAAPAAASPTPVSTLAAAAAQSAPTATSSAGSAPQTLPGTGGPVSIAWPLPAALLAAILAGGLILGFRSKAR